MDRKLEALAFDLSKDAHFHKLEYLRNRSLKAKMDLEHAKTQNKKDTHKLRKAVLSSIKTA